jgi:hypothetical protein
MRIIVDIYNVLKASILLTTRSARAFSDWFIVGRRDFDYCCGCGLAHENRYRAEVNETTKEVKIYMRSRPAVGRTHKRRKERKLYVTRTEV